MLRFLAFLAVAGVAAGAGAAESLTDLEMIGRFAELEKAAENKLAAAKQPNTAVLGPLCLAYSRVKRYGKLFDCLGRLEQRIASGDFVLETDKAWISNSDATPMPGMLRAEALIELGDYASAATEARTALAKVQDRLPYGIWPAKLYRLSLLGTLGLAYALAGDASSALKQLDQLEQFPVGFMGNAIIIPFRDNAMARIYMALGDYAKAFQKVKEEDSAWRRSAWFLNNAAWGYSGEDGRETFVLLPKMFIRGKSLSEIGNLEEAKKVLDAILRNARVTDEGHMHWLALFERGRIAERQQDRPLAIAHYARAVEVIEKQRASINTETNKIGFVGDKQAVYARLIALLAEQDSAVEAFDYVERSKARALVDMLASKKDFAVRGADGQKAKLALANLESADLAARAQEPGAKPGESSGRRSLEVARREILAAAPELSTLVTVNSVPSEEIKALLGADEALVEYYYQDRVLYAFVLTRERIGVLKLDAGKLGEEVRELRRALESAGSEAWLAPAQTLHARLWKPLESMLNVPNIVIVAHGALHYVPFAALRGADEGFLVDRYSLRFLPSAGVLKYLRPAVANNQAPLIAFGNPDLGDPRLDLRFAEDEAKAVAGIFPASRVLVRKDASETNFKNAAAAFSRIHFATHGKFDAGDPLGSALYLAKDAGNDGALTVGELYSTNLDADLVTLSACETGLGKIANGDDVVGLTRGFLYAGSRSIVASLWSVDDQATAQLMKAFYENLAGMNKVAALRRAQIATRQNFPHPFFWAAFQLTGRAE